MKSFSVFKHVKNPHAALMHCSAITFVYQTSNSELYYNLVTNPENSCIIWGYVLRQKSELEKFFDVNVYEVEAKDKIIQIKYFTNKNDRE